ncbi:MAG TPA: nucleotidyl transferase AbiEii/AbiGii toxin family protein [Solirubrobacteraceae bacterium]|nr:nucleotidyl transferase AbiEii/AbiGii toxin family protein [Solirubrobacteraceae bacterium]
MNIELLELAASVLGELTEDVVFVGGATVGLWISDPAAPPVRATDDVDVVVEVTTRTEFYEFEAKLRAFGFSEDQRDGVICRWRHLKTALILDAMPSRADILGFENEWQGRALPHALERRLPSGATIRAAPPAYMLAMKLEAFKGRGNRDFLASRDFSDIVTLVDGRPELRDELRVADESVRIYVGREVARLMEDPRLMDGLAGAMRGDAVSQDRVDLVVLPILRDLANLGG